jgi:UDPglucose 6-dehydrogenase
MNIGIVGHGIVGKAVEVGFRDKCTLFISDPKYEAGISKGDVVEHCDYIFVGVPTPYDAKQDSINTTILRGVMWELNEAAYAHLNKPIVIIKSAVTPEVVRSFIQNFKHLEIVVSPEYLTERTSIRDFVNQKCMILGGSPDATKKVNTLYLEHSICNHECNVGYCSAEEACLIKYMENSFMATINIFYNGFKKFYDSYFDTKDNERFNHLLDVFYNDERMGVLPFRYTVPGPDGDLGYGGKCLPKDTNAIIGEAKRQNTPLTLLEKVNEINNEIRTDKNWRKIDGAFT